MNKNTRRDIEEAIRRKVNAKNTVSANKKNQNCDLHLAAGGAAKVRKGVCTSKGKPIK